MTHGRHWIGFLVAALCLVACGDIERRPRQPNVRPVAALSVPTTASVGELVVLDASESYDPDGLIVEYRFSPGDSDEQLVTAEPTLGYRYDAVDDYTVTLTVVDDRGGKDSVASVVSIGP